VFPPQLYCGGGSSIAEHPLGLPPELRTQSEFCGIANFVFQSEKDALFIFTLQIKIPVNSGGLLPGPRGGANLTTG